ncbi:MAG: hypothetical protein EBR82_35805 [Caulobacteraceae bacterium]|nr:hypothetical protein [Caulobacteraceae bacterium]
MNNIQNSLIVNAIIPTSTTSTSTATNGATIDLGAGSPLALGGFQSLNFIVNRGDTVAATTAFKVQENIATVWTDISGASVTMPSGTAGTAMVSVTLGGSRQSQLRAVYTTGSAAGTYLFSAICVGQYPANGVVGATESARATSAGMVAGGRAVV